MRQGCGCRFRSTVRLEGVSVNPAQGNALGNGTYPTNRKGPTARPFTGRTVGPLGRRMFSWDTSPRTFPGLGERLPLRGAEGTKPVTTSSDQNRVLSPSQLAGAWQFVVVFGKDRLGHLSEIDFDRLHHKSNHPFSFSSLFGLAHQGCFASLPWLLSLASAENRRTSSTAAPYTRYPIFPP